MLAALALFASPALAKDLNGRLGLGFDQQFGIPADGTSLSCLSVRYGLPTGKPTLNLQIQGVAGFDVLDTGNGKFFAGGRALLGVVAEDNMNLYLGAGAGYMAHASESFIRIEPSLGAEFFLFGLENLGFTAQWAVHVDLGTSTRIATAGTGPGVAVHYYF